MGIKKVNVAEPMTGETLPTKVSPWTKVKNFLFQEIKIEMTPMQAKVLGEVRDFWCQEITGADLKEFLFQEVTAQQMKDFWFQKIKF